MLKLTGLDHIALTVSDLERSICWYQEVLGLEHRFPGLWGGVPAMLFAGESGLALFPARTKELSPIPDAGTTLIMRHLAFRVNRANFEAAQAALREQGIPFNFQDHEISQSIYFRDPDGYQLEITTYDFGSTT